MICIWVEKKLKGFAEAVLDEYAIAAHIVDYVRYMPMTANALGVHVENGMPNSDDVNRLAKERLFIKICLESGNGLTKIANAS